MISKVQISLSIMFLGGQVLAGPKEMAVDGVTYHVLRVPSNAIRIIWKDESGKALRTFAAVRQYMTSQGEIPETLMNGGIFEPDGSPSGLLIQNGKKLKSVNRKDGKGNFFLKPNGIFYITSNGAAVVRTEDYPPKKTTVLQAVQSGPLLLHNGVTHPKFNKESKSRLHRNGVGISKDGEVIFAMSYFRSPKFPNLYEFAQLFKTFGCEDALFLDGDLSQMRSGRDTMKASNAFGSVIAVLNTKKSDN